MLRVHAPSGCAAFAVAVVACALVAGPARAGVATDSIAVQLSVAASCSISASAVNFGAVAFGGASPSDVTSAAGTINCGAGSPYSYMLSSPQATAGNVFQLQGASTPANKVAYQIKTSGGANIPSGSSVSGMGVGSLQSLNLTFHITGYSAATPQDTYTDSVTITVNW